MNYSNSILKYITTKELLNLLTKTQDEQLLIDYIEFKLECLTNELTELYEEKMEEEYQRGLDDSV